MQNTAEVQSSNPLPRWRGFNLPEMFVGPHDLRFDDMIRSPRGRFAEDDLRWIAEFGFDFVRLPLCYHWWTRYHQRDPFEIEDRAFDPVDRALELAGRLGLHVSICLHHAPGFCINPAPWPEPFDLWKDASAVDCFCHHWAKIARRYSSISGRSLDFDLVNEPAHVSPTEYTRAVAPAIRSIRAVSPADRWIISDGLDGGNVPVPELSFIDSRIAQSCRGYRPAPVTHYLAWWAGSNYTRPAWPQPLEDGTRFGRDELWQSFQPWRDLLAKGTGVFCGEFGCWNRTPHNVVLAWMDDLLSMLKQMNVGWALWNFRGSFGILDSTRSDIEYADFHGLPLDREMLLLLQRS